VDRLRPWAEPWKENTNNTMDKIESSQVNNGGDNTQNTMDNIESSQVNLGEHNTQNTVDERRHLTSTTALYLISLVYTEKEERYEVYSGNL
jgi:hypothetical protein